MDQNEKEKLYCANNHQNDLAIALSYRVDTKPVDNAGAEANDHLVR